jgi:diacylglycerol kinase family enzyme
VHIANVLSITDIDGKPAQGADWKAHGIDMVIAAGGDGLVGGVTAHIVNSGLPLGLLPLGTANDVARTVGIPLDIQQAVDCMLHGQKVAIDLGLALPAEQEPFAILSDDTSATSPEANTQSTYFVHALTVGLNATFARLATDPAMRQRYGNFTYPIAVFDALRSYQPIDVRLQFSGLVTHPSADTIVYQDNVHLQCRAIQVTVVNAPVFWGALQATVPGVSLHDQTLDIIVIEDAAPQDLFMRITQFFHPQTSEQQHDKQTRYPQLAQAELTAIPGIHHLQAKNIIIATDGGSTHDATLDGEIRGTTPIRAYVPAEKLQLIVPSVNAVQ